MRRSSGQRRGRVGSPQTPKPPAPCTPPSSHPGGTEDPLVRTQSDSRLGAREQIKLYGRKFDRSICKVIYLSGCSNIYDDENYEDAEGGEESFAANVSCGRG